jgi:hypothetical protein
MIAAGHPALRFEFAAALDRLPKHWQEQEVRRGSRDFELEVWRTGQVAATRAALMLLAARARRAAAQPNAAAWPQFAEYDCIACHHRIGSRGAQSKPFVRQRGLGWGSWHYTMARQMADHATLGRGSGDFQAALEQLQTIMQSSLDANPSQVSRDAEKALEALGHWIGTKDGLSAGGQITSSDVNDILAALVGSDPSEASPNWEDATQAYLALVAVLAAEQDSSHGRGRRHPAMDRRLLSDLLELRHQLAISAGYVGPARIGQPPDDAEPLVRERIHRLLVQITQQMRNRGSQ